MHAAAVFQKLLAVVRGNQHGHPVGEPQFLEAREKPADLVVEADVESRCGKVSLQFDDAGGNELPSAFEDEPAVNSAYFQQGGPKLLNVWASWCLPCIAEAPQLEALKEGGAEIVGVAIRDRPEDIRPLLNHFLSESAGRQVAVEDFFNDSGAFGGQGSSTPAAQPPFQAPSRAAASTKQAIACRRAPTCARKDNSTTI